MPQTAVLKASSRLVTGAGTVQRSSVNVEIHLSVFFAMRRHKDKNEAMTNDDDAFCQFDDVSG